MQVMMNLSMAFSLLDAAEGAPDLTKKCQFKYVPKKLSNSKTKTKRRYWHISNFLLHLLFEGESH